MKNIILIALSIVLGLVYSCSKQDPIMPLGEVVNLTINAIAPNDTLELLKDGKAFYQTGGTDNKAKITVPESGAEIQIRKKGETEIRAKRVILPNAFEQRIDIIFENGKIYEKFIKLKITGYQGVGLIDIYVDDKLIPPAGADVNGNPMFPTEASVPVEPGQNRLVEARKRGAATVVASQAIVSDQNEQEFKFYYDGDKNVSSIDVGPLANPQNMLVMVKFSSTLDIYQGPSDFVIFKQDPFGVNTYFGRIELPTDGSFSKTMELPSLAGQPERTGYIGYIYKRGTMNVIPYNTANEMLPIKPSNQIGIVFKAGDAAIFVLKDQKVVRERPAALKGTTFSNLGENIAPYIKTINFK